MYERLEICPSCKHTEFVNEKIITDFSVSKESFALVNCKKCQLLFTNPRPAPENINKYYESEDYISHTDKGNNLTNLLYKLVRTRTLKNKVKLINQYHNEGSLLDFGCGTGDFLKKAKDNRWEVTGIEPDIKAKNIASKKLLSDIYNSLEDLPGKENYDIITAWHVLEHVHDLRGTLKILKKLLSQDGTLIIAVPNYHSYDAEVYDTFWAGYDVPRHLYHFNIQSFSYLMTKMRLRLIDTIPMRFDSYYVSLLSEKYKNGNSSFLKAFINGYQSNSRAEHTGNFSSLIYIIKK